MRTKWITGYGSSGRIKTLSMTGKVLGIGGRKQSRKHHGKQVEGYELHLQWWNLNLTWIHWIALTSD